MEMEHFHQIIIHNHLPGPDYYERCLEHEVGDLNPIPEILQKKI